MPPSLSFNRPNKTRAFLLCGIFPVQKSEGLLMVECKIFLSQLCGNANNIISSFASAMILKHPIFFFFLTWYHIGMEVNQISMRTHSAAVPQRRVFLPRNPSLCLKWVARDSKTPTLDFIPVFTPTSGIHSSLRPAGAVSNFNSIQKISFDART